MGKVSIFNRHNVTVSLMLTISRNATMSVVPCTLQRGNGDEILTLYRRKYLLQWRADQQQSVSHHHPEDSLRRSRPRQPQAGVKALRSRTIIVKYSFIYIFHICLV